MAALANYIGAQMEYLERIAGSFGVASDEFKRSSDTVASSLGQQFLTQRRISQSEATAIVRAIAASKLQTHHKHALCTTASKLCDESAAVPTTRKWQVHDFSENYLADSDWTAVETDEERAAYKLAMRAVLIGELFDFANCDSFCTTLLGGPWRAIEPLGPLRALMWGLRRSLWP